MRTAFSALLALASFPAIAGDVRDCRDDTDRARNIAEPWAENTRTFANGAVRIAVLDTLEPAAAAFHLLVLSPPYDEIGDRQCRLVSCAHGMGYASLTLEGMDAGYDPTRGLTLEMPITQFNPNTGGFDAGSLLVTLDQATGEITAEEIGS
jgi:hypothetical protein